jgi:hypothetical protein
VEDVALAPALEHALLEVGKGLRRVYGGVTGHCFPVYERGGTA